MKNFALNNSRTALIGALNDLINHIGLAGSNLENLPPSVQQALAYAKEVEEKDENDLSEWKEEFMQFFDHDDFNQVMDENECEHLFLQSLKGSSDITYELLQNLGSDYQVSIDDIIMQGRAAKGVKPIAEGSIYSYLDISNGNLSQATFDWLHSVTEEQLGMTVATYDYGVFVSVPTEADEIKNLPADLEVVLAYARTKNCYVVRFDRDADFVDGIQQYNW